MIVLIRERQKVYEKRTRKPRSIVLAAGAVRKPVGKSSEPAGSVMFRSVPWNRIPVKEWLEFFDNNRSVSIGT